MPASTSAPVQQPEAIQQPGQPPQVGGLLVKPLFHPHISAAAAENILVRACTLRADGYRIVRPAHGQAKFYAVFKPENTSVLIEEADYFVNAGLTGCSCGGCRKYGDCKHRLHIEATVREWQQRRNHLRAITR